MVAKNSPYYTRIAHSLCFEGKANLNGFFLFVICMDSCRNGMTKLDHPFHKKKAFGKLYFLRFVSQTSQASIQTPSNAPQRLREVNDIVFINQTSPDV